MRSLPDLDRLLAMMDVTVEGFAMREVGRGCYLNPAPAGTVLVLCVMRGAIDLAIPGRERRICGPKDVILLPPGLGGRLAPIGSGSNVRVAAGIASARLGGSIGLLDRAEVPVVENFNGSELIRLSFREMLAIGTAGRGLGASATINALMKVCLLMILRRFFERPGIDHKIISALADPRLARAVASVLDNPGAPHTLETLARHAGLGRSTFIRLFGEALGQPPMEFVAKARLYQAASMLRTGAEPIKAIAAAVGFLSRSHFSKMFRDAYGRDPTAFRQEHQQSATPGARAVTEI